jgi:hypothetical protein
MTPENMRMKVLRTRTFGKAELAIKRRFPKIGPKFIEFAWPLLMRIFWRGSYTSYKASSLLHKSLNRTEPTLPNEANGCRLPNV